MEIRITNVPEALAEVVAARIRKDAPEGVKVAVRRERVKKEVPSG